MAAAGDTSFIIHLLEYVALRQAATPGS
jgi:hypothetical protein